MSQFDSVQSLSCVWLFATPWSAACQASLSITKSWSLLKLMSIESVWCHPIISSPVIPSPPTFNLSQHQGLFKWVSSSHQVAKVMEFQLQHQSFQWTPRTYLRLVKATIFPVVMYGCESWTIKKAECRRIDAFELCVGEDSWESLGLQGDPTSPS